MTVWKFTLEKRPETVLTVPVVNEPLCVRMQNGIPTLWLRVDEASAKHDVTLLMFGTGWSGIPDRAEYLGTVADGSLIWHYFWTPKAGS